MCDICVFDSEFVDNMRNDVNSILRRKVKNAIEKEQREQIGITNPIKFVFLSQKEQNVIQKTNQILENVNQNIKIYENLLFSRMN